MLRWRDSIDNLEVPDRFKARRIPLTVMGTIVAFTGGELRLSLHLTDLAGLARVPSG